MAMMLLLLLLMLMILGIWPNSENRRGVGRYVGRCAVSSVLRP